MWLGGLVVLIWVGLIGRGGALPGFTSNLVNSDMFAGESPVACSAVSASGVTISKVYLAQTHLMEPLLNPFFYLAADRSALLKVDLLSATPQPSPEVSATATFTDGTTTKLCLRGPATIPTSLDQSNQNKTNSFLLTLPRSWISSHTSSLSIQVLGSTSKSYTSQDLKLDGKVARWSLLTMEFLLYRYPIPECTKPDSFQLQYFAMLPFSSIDYIEFPVAVQLRTMAIGPRSDSVGGIAYLSNGTKCLTLPGAGPCLADMKGQGSKDQACFEGDWYFNESQTWHTGCTSQWKSGFWCPLVGSIVVEDGKNVYSSKMAWGYCSDACKKETGCPWAGFGIIGAVLSIQNSIRQANGMDSYAHGYGAISSSVGGGLGGGTGGAGDGYGGIFFHEMGHAFGLGHGQDEYTAQKNPYPGDTNPTPGGGVGITWGYEQDTGYFTPVLKESGNLNLEKQDPMQGGSGDQRSGRLWTMFSDYNAKRIYDNIAGSFFPTSSVQYLPSSMGPNSGKHYLLFNNSGRSFWDESQTAGADGSKFVRWNGTQYVVQPLSYSFPTKRNIPVFTVFGSFSFTNPEVSLFYPLLYYKGNIRKIIDPTNSDDWTYIRTTNYCYWGCDFYLKVTFDDGAVAYCVLQNDLYRKSDHLNPTSGNSFFYFAVNFEDAGHGQLRTAALVFRPLKKGVELNSTLTLDQYFAGGVKMVSVEYPNINSAILASASWMAIFALLAITLFV